MPRAHPSGMKVGLVSLWLLLLLSEHPMYGYEILRELQKRFSGYWKPKTGTIYPALEKLEADGAVTSRIEFRDPGIDRKHYALTKKGQDMLDRSMAHWVKMFDVLERFREAHESIYRHDATVDRAQLAETVTALGQALRRNTLSTSKVFPGDKNVAIRVREPLRLEFAFVEEGENREVWLGFEWLRDGASVGKESRSVVSGRAKAARP